MSSKPLDLAREILSRPIVPSKPTQEEFNRVAAALEASAINPSPDDFDVLVMTAADFLYRNQFLPDWLSTFSADVLSGKRKRPKKRGPNGHGTWIRDYRLFLATEEVGNTFGLPKYANNDLYPEKETAAKIVSVAAGCKIETVVKAYQIFIKTIKGKEMLANSSP